MVRLLSAIILVALVAAATSLLLSSLGRAQASERQLALAAGVALAVASVAALAAMAAHWRANALAAEIRRLAAAVDTALRTNASATLSPPSVPIMANREAATPAPSVAAAAAEPRMPDARPPAAATNSNVVQLETRKSTQRRKKAAGSSVGKLKSQDGIRELSLQPIITVTTGKTAGFDVFRCLRSGETYYDLRTSAGAPEEFEKGAFERETLEAAVQAARRRTGASAENPLYVAVSDALLRSPDELTSLLKLVNSYPVVAEIIVVCIDAGLLAANSSSLDTIERMTQAGFRLALEIDTNLCPPALSNPALSCVRISGARLMQAEPEGIAALMKQVTDRHLKLVATNIRSETEAVALLDRGVDLMVGEHFCEPRRLKPEQSAEAAG